MNSQLLCPPLFTVHLFITTTLTLVPNRAYLDEVVKAVSKATELDAMVYDAANVALNTRIRQYGPTFESDLLLFKQAQVCSNSPILS
jgi:hypothetical protein